MTAAELIAALKTRNGITSLGDGLITDAVLYECVSNALADVSAEDRWPWLLTSASLTFTGATAPLPTGWTASKSLLIGGYPVPHVGLDEMQSSAVRFVWTEVGANIVISPTPTVALTTPTLYYYRDEGVVDSGADAILLPVTWHRYLLARASYHLNVRRSFAERASLDDTEWRTGLERMRAAKRATVGTAPIRSSFRTKIQARWT